MEPGTSAPEQGRLRLGAVIGSRIRGHDIAGPDLAQPSEVGPRVEVTVENTVLGKVVLTEPTAGDGDAGLWQVDRFPVPRGGYDLDAIGRGHTRLQKGEGGRPVGRLCGCGGTA